jgi:DNA-binding HxlR family transcriptional regulator
MTRSKKQANKRSYNQVCPFARTMDIVGERWTLLILRTLIAGPQRYKDLLDNLPGIGTNLLAARLKELEREGIVQRRRLPPPAGSVVYEFTELGRGLEEPLLALARWGLWTLARPNEDDYFPRVMIGPGLKLVFNPEAAAGVHETYEYRIDSEVFHVRVDHGSMELTQGPASKPDLVVTSDLDTWMGLASGDLSAPQAVASGGLKVEGEPAVIVRATRIFPPPKHLRERARS